MQYRVEPLRAKLPLGHAQGPPVHVYKFVGVPPLVGTLNKVPLR
jgi:hypothetical protein